MSKAGLTDDQTPLLKVGGAVVMSDGAGVIVVLVEGAGFGLQIVSFSCGVLAIHPLQMAQVNNASFFGLEGIASKHARPPLLSIPLL